MDEYRKTRKSLRYSILDGSFFNIMDGFTTPFIIPYALELKAGAFIIGVLNSLPELIGGTLQLMTLKLSEAVKSRKAVVAAAAFVQALLWLPVLFVPYIPGNHPLLLVAFITLIATANSFISPLWRGLMGDLVPEHERGKYFSLRNKILAIVCFVSTIAAGLILTVHKANPLSGFAILFAVALLARLISSLFIATMHEKPRAPSVRNGSSFAIFVTKLTTTDYGRFVLFICLFRVAVALSAPFFVVLELKHLGFTFWQFTMLTAVEIVGSVALLGFWGKVNDNYGSKAVITATGLMIPFVPLVYAITPNFAILMATSLLSGIAWGGFNLAIGNYLFDATSPGERIRQVSYFNFLHAIAVFIGAMSGGVLVSALGESKIAIITVFFISAAMRLAIAAMLFPMIREMRVVSVAVDKRLFNYSVFIKPRRGLLEDPFDYYLAYEKRRGSSRVLHLEKEFAQKEDEAAAAMSKEAARAEQDLYMRKALERMKKK